MPSEESVDIPGSQEHLGEWVAAAQCCEDWPSAHTWPGVLKKESLGDLLHTSPSRPCLQKGSLTSDPKVTSETLHISYKTLLSCRTKPQVMRCHVTQTCLYLSTRKYPPGRCKFSWPLLQCWSGDGGEWWVGMGACPIPAWMRHTQLTRVIIIFNIPKYCFIKFAQKLPDFPEWISLVLQVTRIHQVHSWANFLPLTVLQDLLCEPPSPLVKWLL